MKNIGKKPVAPLKFGVRFVKPGTTEVLGEGSTWALGFGDPPLEPGYTKTVLLKADTGLLVLDETLRKEPSIGLTVELLLLNYGGEAGNLHLRSLSYGKGEPRPAASGQLAEVEAGGYKNFRWGDTLTAIKSQVPDLKEEFNLFGAPQTAMLHLHSAEFNHKVPNPLAAEGEIDSSHSDSQRLSFFLLEGRLIGVTVELENENAFEQLQEKYGAKQPMTIQRVNFTYDGAAWVDPTRVIVWEQPRWSGPGSELLDIEWVTYIDGAWFSQAEKRLLSERSATRDHEAQRLD